MHSLNKIVQGNFQKSQRANIRINIGHSASLTRNVKESYAGPLSKLNCASFKPEQAPTRFRVKTDQIIFLRLGARNIFIYLLPPFFPFVFFHFYLPNSFFSLSLIMIYVYTWQLVTSTNARYQLTHGRSRYQMTHSDSC